MNLNQVEWSEAQDLLLKLVKTLAPFAEGEFITPSALEKYLFIPPKEKSSEAFILDQPIQILTQLKVKVDAWVGKSSEPMMDSSSPLKAERENFPAQAKYLVSQVREAIGQLCHSSNIKNPEVEALKEVLKQIKPRLDKVIESVKQEISLDPSEPLVFKNEPVQEGAFRRTSFLSQAKVLPPTRQTPSEKREEREESSQQVKKQSLDQKYVKSSDFEVIKSESQPPIFVKVVEKTSLIAAPFSPEVKNFTSPKKKKKRKSLWLRDEEDQKNS